MGDLSTAVRLAEEAEQAQRNAINFLLPFAKQYGEFMHELNDRHWDLRDNEVDRFVEIDGTTFHLRGDEMYLYGETYEPVMLLPFAFVEDPLSYKNRVTQEKQEREHKAALKKKQDAQARIVSLEAQLEKARKDAGL